MLDRFQDIGLVFTNIPPIHRAHSADNCGARTKAVHTCKGELFRHDSKDL